MSGGVDSSVSALLLQKAGYEVTGVFIRVWQPEGGLCTWKDERRDAMRVCAHLHIPFVTLDLRDAYKTGVVDYMIQEYVNGKTPNPDVMCNRQVKFGAFYQWAKEQGADYIATGHYAQSVGGNMLEGEDKNKDQSYFLWTLLKSELEHILFPVGHLQKAEVRKLAEHADLPVFDKKDSQGVCFIGHIDMKEFLKGYIETTVGDVLDTDGTVIGQHEGALLYTLGERHGFRLFKQQTDQVRMYIIAKDIIKNTLTVSSDLLDTTHQKTTVSTVTHTVLRESFEEIQNRAKAGTLECRMRYRQKRVPISSIEQKGDTLTVTLTENHLVSSGQSMVFYSGNLCLGGGVMN